MELKVFLTDCGWLWFPAMPARGQCMANTRLNHCVAIGVKRTQKYYHASDIEKCGNFAERKIPIGQRRFESVGVYCIHDVAARPSVRNASGVCVVG